MEVSKMKLAFTTLGCPDWSFGKILDEAQKMGYSGIEIRGLEGKMLAEEIVQFFPENKDLTLEAVKAHNLVITGFGSSVKFDDAKLFDSAIEEGKKSIDVCSFMGIPTVRIFGDKILPEETETGLIARIAKGAQILADYGEDKNVSIVLETHGHTNTLERIQGVFEKVKSNNFKLLWDIGNTDPVYEDNYMDFYKPVKDLISHTHYKDHIRGTLGDQSTYKHCEMGKGQIPIIAITKQLLADGYSGYFTLEWEKKWIPELSEPEIAFPDFVKLMKSI